MKIIITGASGSIGNALVPYLSKQGHKLLLVGRDVGMLQDRFPDQASCAYRDLGRNAIGFDACVHLAVMNNAAGGNLENFRAANVRALKLIFNEVENAGIRHFINLTSFHAANPNQNDPYAVSKREADAWITEQKGMRITLLQIPAVYSDAATGNLAKVNKLPGFLQPTALVFLGALKPWVSMERVVEAICEAIKDNAGGKKAIANQADKNPVFAIYKKLIDWGFAISILLLAWWLLLAVFIVTKLTSKGPAIFAQERIGRYGKNFTCYKFRTMHLGTRQAATHDLGHDAITGIGAFLRKTKIDELPQIINILRGELSLVGPRPCLPMQTQLIKEREQRDVTDVLPGITGWAQINGVDMSDPVRLAQADSDYIARRTIPFELSIVLRTFIGAGRGDRVRPVL